MSVESIEASTLVVDHHAAAALSPAGASAAPSPVSAPAVSGGLLLAKELACGTVAGWAQVMTGQPFDIIKVRLQSSNAYSGMLDAGTRIAREEGPAAFYKGTVAPLIGIGACVSLQFVFLGAAKRYFSEQNNGAPLTSGQLYLAGAWAGFGNSFVSGPVEHIRIRLQTQTGSGPTAQYKGPIDALRKIHATDGLRGVYHGQATTLLRELHGYGMYFASYEYLVSREMKQKGIRREDVPVSSAILYGAAGGYAMWATMYPIDVIKSRLQTDGLASQAGTAAKKYSGAIDCARQLWAETGPKGFFRGLTPTLIRSPVVNGVTFAVFEMTMRAVA